MTVRVAVAGAGAIGGAAADAAAVTLAEAAAVAGAAAAAAARAVAVDVAGTGAAAATVSVTAAVAVAVAVAAVLEAILAVVDFFLIVESVRRAPAAMRAKFRRDELGPRGVTGVCGPRLAERTRMARFSSWRACAERPRP